MRVTMMGKLPAQFTTLAGVLVASCCSGVLSQHVAHFGEAHASSTYSSGVFPAEAAISKGSAYWCSSGKHMPGQHVVWTGTVNARQQALGVTINWAYGAGEYRVLSSADGSNFVEAVPWHSPARSEVSYTETLMFDAPQDVKSLAIVMRSPKSWGYFGINDAALLVKPGPSMLVLGAAPNEGEMCLVASSEGIAVRACLDAISAGSGEEIFRFGNSQLVSVATGACVSLVSSSTGLQPALLDCRAAEDASDGRSQVSLTEGGQLKWAALGNYCLVAGSSGLSAAACDVVDEMTFRLAAVQEFDPSLAEGLRDAAGLLQASVLRQSTLLQQLQRRASSCSFMVAGENMTRGQDMKEVLMALGDPALEVSSKISSSFGIDLDAAKSLLAESKSTLTKVQGKVAQS